MGNTNCNTSITITSQGGECCGSTTTNQETQQQTSCCGPVIQTITNNGCGCACC